MVKLKRFVFIAVALFVVGLLVLWLRGNAPAHFDVPAPVPPAGPNAFGDFARAAALEREVATIKLAVHRNPTQGGPYSANYGNANLPGTGSAQKTQVIAAENQPALQAMRAGFAQSYFPPPIRSLEHLDAPYNAGYHQLALLCRFEAGAAAQRKDWAEVERCSLDAIQLGAEISRHTKMSNENVSISCAAIGRETAFAALDHLTSATARQDAARLERIDKLLTTPVEALIEEKWFEESVLNPYIGRESRSWYWMIYPKRKIARNFTRHFDAELRRYSLPYPAARQIRIPADSGDPITSLLLQISDGDMETLRFRMISDQTYNTLLMTMLALRAYKTDHHGEYPQSLDELSPAYLANIPLDPFADHAPLRYAVISDGQSYLLYSIGPDAVDNGGTPIIPKLSSYGNWYASLQAANTGDIVAGKNFQ